ncbi:MAG: exodeoxyribonuclease VII large subunit [Chitinophagales bacterium]|nr:exodeoxyribonuclease VII large subunit [Chitinophagales bacterium]
MQKIKLSELTELIHDAIQENFGGEVFLITAQITDVTRKEADRRCYLKFIEKENGRTTAEIRAVFWSNYYSQIENFEKQTKQRFANGIEINCIVRVRFHPVYGLNLDVLQIDLAHTLGTLELERQQTLERLLKENPQTIQLYDGAYRTFNNRLPLPLVIENIALITAQSSDGQRDFLQELTKNKHGYTFSVTEFLVTIQGDNAHKQIIEQLAQIEKERERFDVVAIVRGGGSQTDFRPFEDYELSKCVANFPIPVFTGIGHDRNQSIVDLMAREQKTPTKVASFFVEHNFEFENRLIDIRTNFFAAVREQLEKAKENLKNAKRIVKLASPQAILDRGFAIITSKSKIISEPADITENMELQTLLRNEIIHSVVTEKTKNEKGLDV